MAITNLVLEIVGYAAAAVFGLSAIIALNLLFPLVFTPITLAVSLRLAIYQSGSNDAVFAFANILEDPLNLIWFLVPLTCALLVAAYMTAVRHKQAVDIALLLALGIATVLRMVAIFGSAWYKEEALWGWEDRAPDVYLVLELGVMFVLAGHLREHSDYKYPAPFAVEDWGRKQAENLKSACEQCMTHSDAPRRPIRWSWQLEAAGIAILELALSIVRRVWLREVSGARPNTREALTTEELLTLILAASHALWEVARRRRRQDLQSELHLD